jgi:chromosome segregation ATPase
MRSLEELESTIKDGEMLKVRINDRLTTLTNQYTEIAKQLSDLGIDPKNAEKEIQEKEKEYVNALQKLENMLPIDIIEQYKNHNFSMPTTTPISTSAAPF